MTDRKIYKRFLKENESLYKLLCVRRNLFEEFTSYEVKYSKYSIDIDSGAREYIKKGKALKHKIRSINKRIKELEALIQKIVKDADKMKIELPLVQICRTYKLNYIEKKIMTILFFSAFKNNDCPGTMCVNELLGLLFQDRTEFVVNKKIFYENSPLRKNTLIRIGELGFTLLDTKFMLTEKMLRKIAGDTENLEDKDIINEFDGYIESQESRNDLLQIRDAVTKFENVVLNDEKRISIERALWQIQNSKRIFEDWGFEKTLHYGTTVSMLFYGPPGTGKTMTAEAIAHKLNKKLGIANYERILNCWVGESEKNIIKVFEEAREKDCVLVFDEADALFSKRLEAVRSVEMMYNRIINLLLRELERFEGVVILTSNRELVLDEALERRITLRIKFDMPAPEERAKIWASLFTDRAPLADDVDFKKLGERYELSGGYIKNAVLNAVRECAYRNGGEKKSRITMAMLEKSAENEIESMLGKKNEKEIGF